MIVNFGDISTHLGSRLAGASIREKVVTAIRKNDEVVFDFTGIESITSAFADECFAKLIETFPFEKIRGKTVFQNASPFVKVSISNAFRERLSREYA